MARPTPPGSARSDVFGSSRPAQYCVEQKQVIAPSAVIAADPRWGQGPGQAGERCRHHRRAPRVARRRLRHLPRARPRARHFCRPGRRSGGGAHLVAVFISTPLTTPPRQTPQNMLKHETNTDTTDPLATSTTSPTFLEADLCYRSPMPTPSPLPGSACTRAREVVQRRRPFHARARAVCSTIRASLRGARAARAREAYDRSGGQLRRSSSAASLAVNFGGPHWEYRFSSSGRPSATQRTVGVDRQTCPPKFPASVDRQS